MKSKYSLSNTPIYASLAAGLALTASALLARGEDFDPDLAELEALFPPIPTYIKGNTAPVTPTFEEALKQNRKDGGKTDLKLLEGHDHTPFGDDYTPLTNEELEILMTSPSSIRERFDIKTPEDVVKYNRIINQMAAEKKKRDAADEDSEGKAGIAPAGDGKGVLAYVAVPFNGLKDLVVGTVKAAGKGIYDFTRFAHPITIYEKQKAEDGKDRELDWALFPGHRGDEKINKGNYMWDMFSKEGWQKGERLESVLNALGPLSLLLLDKDKDKPVEEIVPPYLEGLVSGGGSGGSSGSGGTPTPGPGPGPGPGPTPTNPDPTWGTQEPDSR